MNDLTSDSGEVRRAAVHALSAHGAFGPTLLQALREVGDRATAALIEARADPSVEVRTWARETLEELGKRTPGDTVQTTDDRVLVDVLRAYGTIQDIDALAVVLSFVNSDRSPVRSAARDATLAYGLDAFAKVRSTYAALSGEHIPSDTGAHAAARMLFDAFDRLRLRDVYAQLDDGLVKADAGDVDGAIARFDEVLARQPQLDRRSQMAPAYVARAHALETTERELALDDLERAVRLTDDGPERARIESEIEFVEGEDLLFDGIPDSTHFERALELDATNAMARRELERLRGLTYAARAHQTRAAALAWLAGMAMTAVALFAWIGRRRPTAPDNSTERRRT